MTLSVRLTSRPSLGVAWALFASCAPDHAPPSEPLVLRDSSGIRIVESGFPAWSEGLEWTIDPTPTVSIGTASGDSAHLTWDIGGAARLSDGRLAVLASGVRRLVIFDRGGKAVRSIGRPGRGPGEFSEPTDLQVTAGDTLIVWEGKYGRVTSFDTTGTVLDIRHTDLAKLTDAFGAGVFSESRTPLADGSFVAHVSPPQRASDFPSDEVVRSPVYYLRVRSDYSVDSLGVYRGIEIMYLKSGALRLPALPAFPTRSILTGGGTPMLIYVSNGDSYDIRVFDDQGRFIRLIRRTIPQLPIEDGEVQAAREIFYSRNGRELWEKRFAALPEQTHHPEVSDLVVDREGSLWARDKKGLWSVFDHDGRWLGRVTVPVVRIYDIGPDFILGLTRDSLDVEHVEEFRLARSR